MPIRSTRISKKNLRQGMYLFIAQYDGFAFGELQAVRARVAGTINDYSRMTGLELWLLRNKEQQAFLPRWSKSRCFLGDLGIRPWNYDQRPTQLFTTRKACERAIKKWNGANPNFLKGD